MRKQLLRLGILCLFVLLACAAKAQNVVATWDFQNRIPASLADVTIQGSKEVKYQLSPSDKNAIKSCYELSTAMTKQRQLIQQAKDLNTKVKFYLKKISLDESQNAGAEE